MAGLVMEVSMYVCVSTHDRSPPCLARRRGVCVCVCVYMSMSIHDRSPPCLAPPPPPPATPHYITPQGVQIGQMLVPFAKHGVFDEEGAYAVRDSNGEGCV